MRAWYGLVRSQPKRLVIVGDQSGPHGWDLVTDLDGNPSALGRRVASWVRGQLV